MRTKFMVYYQTGKTTRKYYKIAYTHKEVVEKINELLYDGYKLVNIKEVDFNFIGFHWNQN